MDFNFKKFKDFIEKEDHSVSPEYDWENMKDGIFSKMESIREEEKPAGSKRKRVGLFLLLFLGLIIIPYAIYDQWLTEKAPEDVNALQQVVADTVPVRSNMPESNAALPQVRESSPSPEGKELNTRREVISANQEKALKQEEKPLKGLPMGVGKPSGTYAPNNELEKDEQYNTAASEPSERIAQNAISNLTPLHRKSLPASSFKGSEIKVLAMDSLYEMEGGLMSPLDKDYDLAPGNRLAILRRGPLPDQLIVEGGITFWNRGLGDSPREDVQYEKPINSFQLQGFYVRSLKRNYFIMGGLQYQQLESRFKYNYTIQDYTIVLEDTVVQVQNDVNTGQQNVIYGDVEQTVAAERRIVHYNKIKLLKLTLAAGKSWHFNSFQTDVYLGVAMNSLVQNKGRMLYRDELISYSGASNELYQNQLMVDAILGLRLHYYLNDKLGVTAGFQGQRSAMNWSKREDISLYPAMFSLQFGVSYYLD